MSLDTKQPKGYRKAWNGELAQHTRGPWTKDGRAILGQAFDDSAKCIVDKVRGGSPQAAEANARLIAAAPDLLVACKAALNDRMYKDWPEVADLLIAAIAKAEGGR